MRIIQTCVLSLLLTGFLAFSSNAEESIADPGQPTRVLSLSLQDFIQLVREKNERIRSQQLEWAISRQAVKKEWSIFEPDFIGSCEHQYNRQRNTTEEAASRKLFGMVPTEIYKERSNSYTAAVEGLIPTGGKVRLGYTLQDMSNTLIDARYDDKESEYRTLLAATLTQPLLKNAGIKTTMAGIRVAEADSEMAFQEYRRQMMRVIADAISAYCDLYLAQEKYKVRKDSVRIAERILEDNRERVKTGKMAETEVLEAEAGLALRRSLESAAKQDYISATNRARSFFSSSAAEGEINIEITDRFEIDKLQLDFGGSLKKAFKLRPEYISSRKKAEREDVRLAFARNQRWPQLDLKGSYGLNGLDLSAGSSWDDALDTDFKSWSVGVELRIPLGGGMKGRSELQAARHRKKQALLELKAVEVALADTIDTAVQNVYSAQEQAAHYRKVVDLNKRLLEVELARLDAGKSNSRLVLEKEADLNKAKEAELEALVNYKKAVLGLETAEGSLLLNHNIEVMEVVSP